MTLHIRDKINCLDLSVKKVSANKNTSFSHDKLKGRLKVKREIKHSFKIPGRKTDTFQMTVRDRLSFGRAKGPFTIEVVVSGTVILNEQTEPRILKGLLKKSENIDFLVNQGLHYSCASIAYLTDQMGFSPIVLAPKYH